MDQTADKEKVARRIKATVHGIVQGVGFRPFIYQLARRYDLKGYVVNTSHGVDIDVEGEALALDSFLRAIRSESPPLANITALEKSEHPPAGYSDFSIHESQASEGRSTLISPDICVCDECLAELLDVKNRRQGYPFINCTNCGPRYTIIEDIPYDRPKTSMKSFPMCPECAAEYHDPLNRRFHAQPNACWNCGPQITLFDTNKNRVVCKNPIIQAANLLHQGKILAIKGLGGFHLVVDATIDEAVHTLRKRKHREEKPLALMSPDIETIGTYARVTSCESKVLASPQRPIVLLKKKARHNISPEVAPRHKYFGVMLPYTPLHYLLLKQGFTALVMTSGNLSEEPIAIGNDEAFRRLSHIADYFLMHDRDIYMRCDDSVVRVNKDKSYPIRRARGYVPVPIILKENMSCHRQIRRGEPEILACGGELKNTICLTKRQNAFLSQHIGDLENLETLESFTEVIGHLKRILEITPRIIAYDLHPEYLSTKYALAQNEMTKYGIQHHHAHIVSCMAEHGLNEEVIGLAMDGTGYGTDGAIWGGEILIARRESFERAGHLDYVPLPGGAAAIKEPWRMAVSYLYQTYGEDFLTLDIPFVKNHDKKILSFLTAAITKKVNTPLTSSCGRLFDGVAALLCLRDKVAYEGQAAIELEMSITNNRRATAYAYNIPKKDNRWVMNIKPIIEQIVADIQAGTKNGVIANKFHHTLTHMFADLCLKVRAEAGINRVALSGGVFQNVTLLTRLTNLLRKNKFKVYTHHLVPANDGGLSLGQAVAAYAIEKNKT
ncbi:MAG: carbamoyltransferase HypF [Thermodesulfobacteriota bacterium]